MLILFLSVHVSSVIGNPQTKGTQSFGRRHNKVHVLCVRCGKSSYHIQRGRCASCGYPSKRTRSCELPVSYHSFALRLHYHAYIYSFLLKSLLSSTRSLPSIPTRCAHGVEICTSFSYPGILFLSRFHVERKPLLSIHNAYCVLPSNILNN